MKFWLLDVSYEIEAEKPVILLWGIEENGQRVLLKDTRFRPYFYVLPKSGADLDQLKKKIELISIAKSPIIKLEVMEKKIVGKKRKVIKVTTLIPEAVRKNREEIRTVEGVEDVLEADIRFSMRYIIDNDLRPCGWHEVEIEEETNDKRYRVERVYFPHAPSWHRRSSNFSDPTA
jgi:DNA polymerase I